MVGALKRVREIEGGGASPLASPRTGVGTLLRVNHGSRTCAISRVWRCVPPSHVRRRM